MFDRFHRSKQGNFAITTAVLATVLIGSMGGVVDLSRQWTDQTAVQRAADAAALAGAKALESGTEEAALRRVQDAAYANLPPDFPTVTFEARVDRTEGTITVVATGSLTPYFLPLLRVDNLPIGATAKSSIQNKVFSDYYFMLDVSESMNIAADEPSRIRLEDLTRAYVKGSSGCAFACHTPFETQNYPTSMASIYDMSRAFNVRLRIDVLHDATDDMIDRILELNHDASGLKVTRVATSGFSEKFMTGLGPATDAVALKNSIRAFKDGNKHSDLQNAFAQFAQQLGQQGDGRSKETPRKVAIVVTDGVRDEIVRYPTWELAWQPSQLGPMEPAWCDAIKRAGIDLAVLEIKYIKRSGETFFDERVASYYDRISPGLKSCASNGLYYLATDSSQARDNLLKMVDDLMNIRRRLVN